jgi:hypothetical protein
MMTGRCARMLRDWHLIQISEDVATLETWTEELEKRGASPPRLTWEPQQGARAPVPGLPATLCENGCRSNNN